MLRDKIAKWVAYAVVDYIKEHGDDLLQEAIDWILSLVTHQDDQIYSVAPFVEGREDFCEAQLNKFREIVEEGNDAK